MSEPKKFQSSNKVLVVGGGMGGIRAALDLAETGRDVVLIDKDFAIGGLMTQLDRTFPTNNCDLCTLSPHLSESGRKLHIQLMTMTQLSGLTGEAGHFKAALTTQPRYIDLEKCTGCGECARKFPESVRFTPGLDHRAPTCMRYPQGTPYAYSIIKNERTDFEGLVGICPAGAILPDDAEKVQEIDIGAIILAPGADVFNPQVLDTYGYGVNPNVVTSLEYERILSASGPTRGELVRPSDGKKPRKIAWIQCVGSRGIQEGCGPVLLERLLHVRPEGSDRHPGALLRGYGDDSVLHGYEHVGKRLRALPPAGHQRLRRSPGARLVPIPSNRS